MWHASISLGGMHIWQWSAKQKKEAARCAEKLLAGVGDGATIKTDGEIAVHYRRKLSAHELATVSQEWLALPAVDPAGV